jgi:3-hydroxyisobutyrate dehydrogenase-like beta-hydroxyacid dehydrogenase
MLMPDQVNTTVGWIGIGAMGSAMSRRLLDGGVQLTVWNRTMSKTEPLAAQGVNVADSILSLGAEVVFLTVTGSADVIEVVTGPTGLLRADHRPSVIVNCSTVSEEASAQARAAAEKNGVDFLAAPISGNPAMVADGTAAIVASGSASAFESSRLFLDLIAPTVIYAGAGDTAMLVKLCSIVLMGTFTTSLYELAALARKGGVQGSAFLDFINASPIGSTYSAFKGHQFTQDVTTLPPPLQKLMERDFDMCLGVARDLGAPVPLSEAARKLI